MVDIIKRVRWCVRPILTIKNVKLKYGKQSRVKAMEGNKTKDVLEKCGHCLL